MTAPGGDATTTLFLDATAAHHFYPKGVLTSTVDTFINDGTTTEYMTQHLGTTVSNVYAKIQATSSREYYRIGASASQDYDAPARPTGLIGSSTSLHVQGASSTYYTVEQYRTYLDGHYAHLVSSISNVVEDPERIAPTPRFGLDESLNSAAADIKASLSSSYSLARNAGVKTRIVGTPSLVDLERELENEILDIAVHGSAKKPRQVDPDDLMAVESEANEVLIDPDQPIITSLPTFTVDSNGDLDIPVPSIEKVEPHVEKPVGPTRQHRFLPPPKSTKSTLDSVTYIGFVDFTTTIDDTVVIFRPKNNYNTQTKASTARIEPTRAFTSSTPRPTLRTTARPAPPAKEPKFFEVSPSRVESSFERPESPSSSIRKQTSGINALKSLLASSAAARSSARNSARFSPSTTRDIVRQTARPALGETQPQLEGSESPATEQPEVNVELVLKTFFTTYSYFTTLINNDRTKTKTRTEVESNILTLTNILDPEDLPATSTITRAPVITSAPILEERPRSDSGRKIDGFLYTTYTLMSTIFDEDKKTSRVITTTEVYSNKPSKSFIDPSPTFAVPSSTVAPSQSIFSIAPSKGIISAFPIRRLEISSIRNRQQQLASEVTTPASTESSTEQEEEEEVAATTPQIVTAAGQVFTDDDEEEEERTTTTEPLQLRIAVTTESTSEAPDTTEQSTEENGEPVLESSFEPKTMYTTFTYFTTLFKDGTTRVEKNLETVTNVMTEPHMTLETTNPSVTLFTTFTYWSTEIIGNETIVSSSEQTKTDILPASMLQEHIESAQLSLEDKIAPSPQLRTEIEQTVFSLPSSSINDLEGSTFTPVLQPSEDVDERTQSLASVTSSLAFDDDDLTLSSEDAGDDDDDEKEEKVGTKKRLLANISRRRIIRPNRTRLRASNSRPGNTFTPVIRPILGRKNIRIQRPTNTASTTVATRTRNSVKPTLIATPASSGPANTPIFNQSSRILASASLFSRARFSSSGRFSSSINPSSVFSSVVAEATESEVATETPTTTPAIITSPKTSRKPFRVRLKELQQARLRKLREKNKQKTETSFPIPNLPSVPGRAAPIFVSSQRQTIARPTESSADESIEIPDDIAARRERARQKIKSLFARRRNQSQQSRRKRQVYGIEYGTRTHSRQSFSSPSSSSYRDPYSSSSYSPQSRSYPDTYSSYTPPFTAFGQTQSSNYLKSNKDNYLYDNDDIYSSSSVRGLDNTRESHSSFRRQAPAQTTSAPRTRLRSRSRSRSRFSQTTSTNAPATSRSRSRQRLRSNSFSRRTTESPTTKASRFSSSRFGSQSSRSFSSSRGRTPSRSSSISSQRNSLFSRPKPSQVIDYDDYYDDYSDTNIQSSNEVPDFITVTHQLPIATRIPVVNFGKTEYQDILSTTPSLEIVAVTALKSTDISNSPVIYANAETLTPKPGVQQILYNGLRATETTSIVLSPTRIRGRRTSVSQIVPSTIYNVETVTTQIIEPIDNNLLLNSLLQHLLLGQSPLQPTPTANLGLPLQQKTAGTQLITHTSTYVTTITEEESTEIPITLRGRAITTTIVESSTKVVTATEFSTETITNTGFLAPTPVGLAGILPTQAPALGAAGLNPALNQQIAALLGNQLLTPQLSQAALLQQQQQASQQAALVKAQQEALLAKQLQEQQQALLLQQQQEELNEQLLAEINLDDFTDEDIANLDIDAVLAAVSGKNPGLVFPNTDLFAAAAAAPQPPSPQTSLVTVFKSGANPGEFSSVVKTVTLENAAARLKREALQPTQPSQIVATNLVELDEKDLSSLPEGGPRGPLGVQLLYEDLVIEPSHSSVNHHHTDNIQITEKDFISVNP